MVKVSAAQSDVAAGSGVDSETGGRSRLKPSRLGKSWSRLGKPGVGRGAVFESTLDILLEST